MVTMKVVDITTAVAREFSERQRVRAILGIDSKR